MNPFQNRPVFLDLTKIWFPVAAIVSIVHRITGVILSMLIPVLIYVFALSLKDEQSFNQVLSYFNSLPIKLICLFFIWALTHHLLAGVRFLLIDLDVGVSKSASSRSSWLVHIGAVAMAALALGIMV